MLFIPVVPPLAVPIRLFPSNGYFHTLPARGELALVKLGYLPANS